MIINKEVPRNYFIKKEYKSRKVIHTRDEHTDGNYWDEYRIQESAVYQFPVYMLAENLIQSKGLSKVADVGCGVGTKLSAIAHRHPTIDTIGYDQNSSITYCERAHQIGKWIAVDFDDELYDPAEKVDLVICSDVVEHVEYPERLFHFIKLLLNEKGLLVISTPERDILRGKRNQYSPKKEHVREWNRKEFTALLNHFSFDVVDWQRQFGVKPGPNRFFVKEFFRQVTRFRSPRYNQVFVAKLSGALS